MFKGTPYVNRHIKRRDEERSMDFHKFNLTHIRHYPKTIDQADGVTINNRKGELQRQNRFTEIERENRILLQKISTIMSKPQTRQSNTVYVRPNKSLNSTIRRQKFQNIEVENAKMLKRLQDKKPNYETQKLKQQWKRQKQVIKNLSNHPFAPDRKKIKRSSLNKYQPLPQKTMEHVRVRVIDGVTFLVTVRLTSKSLKITGDNKSQKQLRIIEIERDEAIEFIEEECQGKVELIFDHLRYDREEQVLYLVSNDVNIEELKQETGYHPIKYEDRQMGQLQQLEEKDEENKDETEKKEKAGGQNIKQSNH